MLALLAFAGAPAAAQAEKCDASCIQYPLGHGEVPDGGIKDHQHPNSEGGTEPRPTPNQPHQGGGGAAAPETESENGDQGKHAGGGGGGGGGDRNPPAGGGAKPKAGDPGGARGVPPGPGPAAVMPAASHPGGGSSPLVPILIAVAALAALSIGAVIYRQRRHVAVG